MRRSNKNDTSGVELEPFADDRENAPFLDFNDGESSSSDHLRPDDSSPSITSVRNVSTWQLRTPSSIVIVATIGKFFTITTGLMMMMPVYRLMEDTMCHALIEDNSIEIIDEMKCKGEDVQSSLAYMLGWLGLVNAIVRELPPCRSCELPADTQDI